MLKKWTSKNQYLVLQINFLTDCNQALSASKVKGYIHIDNLMRTSSFITRFQEYIKSAIMCLKKCLTRLVFSLYIGLVYKDFTVNKVRCSPVVISSHYTSEYTNTDNHIVRPLKTVYLLFILVCTWIFRVPFSHFCIIKKN